jgi:hypothetical protein
MGKPGFLHVIVYEKNKKSIYVSVSLLYICQDQKLASAFGA